MRFHVRAVDVTIHCCLCGDPLHDGAAVYRVTEGRYLCFPCAADHDGIYDATANKWLVAPDAREVL